MQAATWYLGPLGNLRPLISPDGGVSRPVQRFGGVHQALSGARTMDVTGHRASYELSIPWLSPDDSRFLDALHYRTVPGPFHLLDPMARNRLPRPAATVDSSAVTVSSGGVLPSRDAPVDVGVPVRSLDWSAFHAGAWVEFPPVPVLDGEVVTFSVWARSKAAVSLVLGIELSGHAGVVEHSADTVTISTEWDRLRFSTTVPSDAVTARAFLAPSEGTRLWIAAAQVEASDTATDWDTGGGAPTVLLDQIERVSDHYPRNDVTVTLLEA